MNCGFRIADCGFPSGRILARFATMARPNRSASPKPATAVSRYRHSRSAADASRVAIRNPQSAIRNMTAATLLTVMLLLIASPASAQDVFGQEFRDFAGRVDVSSLRLLAAQDQGRIAIVDTVARRQMRDLCGRPTLDGVDPAAAILELSFNTGKYLRADLVDAGDRRFVQALAAELDAEAAGRLMESGRLKPVWLLDRRLLQMLVEEGRADGQDIGDVQDAGRLVGPIQELARAGQFTAEIKRLEKAMRVLLSPQPLAIVPQPVGPWLTIDHAIRLDAVYGRPATRPADSMAGARSDAQGDALPALPADLLEAASAAAGLRNSWRRRDAAGVNDAIGKMGRVLPAMGDAYPSPVRRHAELIYNRTWQGTILWIGYAVAMLLLLAHLCIAGVPSVAGILPARAAGVSPACSTGVPPVSSTDILSVCRSGLWPGLFRWLRPAGLWLMAASTLGLAAAFVVRWILSDRQWYLAPIGNQFEAVVGSALVAAGVALAVELAWKKGILAIAACFYAAAALLAGFMLPEKMGADIAPMPGLLQTPIMAVHVAVIILGHALAGMTVIISLVYLAALCLGRHRRGAAWSWAADNRASASPAGMLATIDRCNLMVAQLAAWTILAGTLLGAWWADFAWGRWWGWDIKEVWALVTLLIFIAILHGRFALGDRSRGPVTAGACILGCAAMLFNWLMVNYFFSGLHSYA